MSVKNRKSVFRGRYTCKLNPKGRLSLPAAFRDKMNTEDSTLIITNNLSQNRKCLDVYTLDQWEKLESQVIHMSSLNPNVQNYQRFYISGGQEINVDSQHRVLIPMSLREYAQLDQGIVVVGLGQKFEIWSENIWNEFFQQLQSGFDGTVAAVAGLMNAG